MRSNQQSFTKTSTLPFVDEVVEMTVRGYTLKRRIAIGLLASAFLTLASITLICFLYRGGSHDILFRLNFDLMPTDRFAIRRWQYTGQLFDCLFRPAFFSSVIFYVLLLVALWKPGLRKEYARMSVMRAHQKALS